MPRNALILPPSSSSSSSDAAPSTARALGPFVRSAAAGAALAAILGSGCAHRAPGPTATPASGPGVTEFEMEPIKITAVKGEDGGVHIESYDAADLFDQAGKALSDKRYDEAIKNYDRVLKEFKDGQYTRASIYNAGLAHQGKKDWDGAIARFRLLADQYGDSSDAKDALFQLGATYAEMSNWPASIAALDRALARKDLNADDKLEAYGRRGFAQFQLRDLDTAERTFRGAVAYYHQIEKEERLETDFYLALCLYHLGQITHERFRAISLRLPEGQMSQDLDDKARLLLTSQRQYIDTIKLGNPGWASASGYQIGSLYEELYDSFIHAPVPPELLKPTAAEKREIYYDEIRKKIRVLLEKSVRTHEANLLMMERLGVHNEWQEKSKVAYAKIQRLLDPSYRADFQPEANAAATPAGASTAVGAPPLPEMPAARGGGAGPAPGDSAQNGPPRGSAAGDGRPASSAPPSAPPASAPTAPSPAAPSNDGRDGHPRPDDGVRRQIL